MKELSLNVFCDCDTINTYLYNIQVEKEDEEEEDLWDMPDEDDEMDLSKPMEEAALTSEASKLALRMFNGEELFIPEDQKISVMNALYSLSKAKWEKKEMEESFEGFTEPVVILDEKEEEEEDVSFEEQLLKERKEKEKKEEESFEEQLLRERKQEQEHEQEQQQPEETFEEQLLKERKEKKEEDVSFEEQLLNERKQQQQQQQQQQEPEETFEEQLLRETREKAEPVKTFDELFNEQNNMFSQPPPSDSIFSMLHQSSTIPSNLPPFQPEPIMQSPFPPNSDFYGYPSFSSNYMYSQPPMQSINFNSSYMPSLPPMQFSSFNETPFAFSSLPPEPVNEPLYELYGDMNKPAVVKEEKPKEEKKKESPQAPAKPTDLPKLSIQVTLKPRSILMRKLKL